MSLFFLANIARVIALHNQNGNADQRVNEKKISEIMKWQENFAQIEATISPS